jgi:hypothetical protein
MSELDSIFSEEQIEAAALLICTYATRLSIQIDAIERSKSTI